MRLTYRNVPESDTACRRFLLSLAKRYPGQMPDPSPFPRLHLFRWRFRP